MPARRIHTTSQPQAADLQRLLLPAYEIVTTAHLEARAPPDPDAPPSDTGEEGVGHRVLTHPCLMPVRCLLDLMEMLWSPLPSAGLGRTCRARPSPVQQVHFLRTPPTNGSSAWFLHINTYSQPVAASPLIRDVRRSAFVRDSWRAGVPSACCIFAGQPGTALLVVS